MIPARTLAIRFLEGDHEFRPRYVTKNWVIKLVKHDPVRAVRVYHELLQRGGTSYAAQEFMALLEQANTQSEFYNWWHSTHMKRDFAPLPA